MATTRNFCLALKEETHVLPVAVPGELHAERKVSSATIPENGLPVVPKDSHPAVPRSRFRSSRWLPCALLSQVLISSFLIGAMSRANTNSAAGLAAELTNPASRDAAFRALLEFNGQHDPTVKVNHVVKCPQPNGSIIYAVFRSSGLDEKMGAGRGRAIGTALLFYWSGTYEGMRSVMGDQVFRDINGDGVVDQVWAIPTHPSGDLSLLVDVLYVVPVLKGLDFFNKSADLPLIVAYNCRGDGPTWAWVVTHNEGDMADQIQFGPVHPDSGKMQPEVTYSWSAESRAWQGPSGGTNEHYMRISPDKRYDKLRVFGEARQRATADHSKGTMAEDQVGNGPPSKGRTMR